MQVNGTNFQTIWVHPENNQIIQVIDQRKLPFEFGLIDLKSATDAYEAIQNMTVRGAPLIGVTGAYGVYLGLINSDDENWKSVLLETAEYLKGARPTAVNLAILIDEMAAALTECDTLESATRLALEEAGRLKNREVSWSEAIGNYGCSLIEAISKTKKNGEPVNILTHCNAGWLACIDWGTATAPIYKAFLKGIQVHVWVDETRPRNQGARLTAWELFQEGVPHTVIPDNAGGHLMQHGQVDLCIVGSDRTTSTGDVANKIGTYLKALAAYDNNIPFYVALPSSTIDFTMRDGIREIPIEQRDGEEVSHIEGELANGQLVKMRIVNPTSSVANYGFDVTPARYITGLITERGICGADPAEISKLFPERGGKSERDFKSHPDFGDGYIKFACHIISEKIEVPGSLFDPLNFWREEMWQKSFIGAYPDGVGFGNISVRVPQSDQFYISGSATGGIPELDQIHYPLVERCDLSQNAIWCRGVVPASSESMSHAAIYSCDPEIGSVVHIHTRKLWDKYLNVLPTTSENIEYGTPEMAYEIIRLMGLPETQNRKVFVMGGHAEGIIAFGKTVEEAARRILNLEEERTKVK